MKRALCSHDMREQSPPSDGLLQRERADKHRRNDDDDGTEFHGESPNPETSSAPVSVTKLAGRSAEARQDFRQARENKRDIF